MLEGIQWNQISQQLNKEELQMDLMSLIKGQLNDTGVLQKLGQSVGADSDQVARLLTKLAPMVLGALGNQKKEQNLDDLKGLPGKFLK